MNPSILLLFLLLLQLAFNQLIGIEYPVLETRSKSIVAEPCSLPNWKGNEILKPTKRKLARTAVLIIAPPYIGIGNIENRWRLGKRVWELYMNSHPNVDCYFVQCASPLKTGSEQVWIEGNTLNVGDPWYENHQEDRILHKTVKALEFLEDRYSHFIRTNLNTFINLKAANNYMETHHRTMYTAPLWQGSWFSIGYGIIFSADVAKHIVNEYNRLYHANEDLISSQHADDCALTALATGVWPLSDYNPFVGYSRLPCGIRQLMCKESFDTTRFSQYGILLSPISSLEEGINIVNQTNKEVVLYRIRDDLNLEDLARLYEHLLSKTYRKLPKANLVEYAIKLNESLLHD